ncbi:DMT family transporter [Pimelobacter simplex]|uniref:DMT family transporter n=1 Tax=Nocardioides simplex TaxID=2045 RepID=A0A7J5DXL6_NOCSI|nr:DMT family transporter [Pimelobacter simplex]
MGLTSKPLARHDRRVTRPAPAAARTGPAGPADLAGLARMLWPGLAAMVLLGSSVAVIDATGDLPVLGLQALRYLVATVAIVLLARLLRVRLVRPGRADAVWIAGGAACGLVGFNLATIVGTRHAEPALLGAAVACIPIVLAVAGPLAVGERPAPRVVLGAAVVTVGAVAVTGAGRGDALGIAMAALLVVCEAGLTLCGARVLHRLGPWTYSAATCAVAAVVFAVLSAATELPEAGALVEPVALAATVYLGAIATAVAFVLWFVGLGRTGPGAAGLCAGAAAPAAALLAVALGGPAPSYGTWVGIGVIAAGLGIGFGRASADGDEVDELLDPPEQRGVEVLEAADAAEDVLPRPGDVGLVAVRPAELLAGALLPVDALGHLRPGLEAEPLRLDRLPDVDERVADDEHVLADVRLHDVLRDPALLGAGDQVVDEDADPPVRRGLEVP